MKIDDFIWLDAIVEKLAVKYHVEVEEVEEALRNRPKFRFVEKGEREGEDVYMALSQTEEGRYFSAIKWAFLSDVYLLSRVPAQTGLLVLTDKALFDICREDMDGLLLENTPIIYRNPA